MSAAVKWTEEQRRVIDQRDSNILVSAAAGSGKTAVLCERIIERLTDDSSPMSLDRLLVMTFTRAAAEELRERISKALRERIISEEEWLRGQDDASEEAELHKGRLSHLRRQKLLLRGADISTIDSLCQKLIREYYQDLDIDPSFRVAEEGELKLIRADVMEELLEESYGEAEEGFLEFAESHSSRQDDGKLSELINSASFWHVREREICHSHEGFCVEVYHIELLGKRDVGKFSEFSESRGVYKRDYLGLFCIKHFFIFLKA